MNGKYVYRVLSVEGWDCGENGQLFYDTLEDARAACLKAALSATDVKSAYVLWTSESGWTSEFHQLDLATLTHRVPQWRVIPGCCLALFAVQALLFIATVAAVIYGIGWLCGWR